MRSFSIVNNLKILGALVAVALAYGGAPGAVQAAPINLVNGTATFSQTAFDPFDHLPGSSVDGSTTGPNGWAIARLPSQETFAEAAVWETFTDVTASTLQFNLIQNFTNSPGHLIGRFKLSVTSDDRSTFADGLATGGDVTANWTTLTGGTVLGNAGINFTTLPDDSILVSGGLPATAIYNLTFAGAFLGITGVRLDVLEDPSLPTGGPGRIFNGNFVLTELTLDASGTVSAVPVPAALPLFLSGLLGMGLIARRRKKNAA